MSSTTPTSAPKRSHRRVNSETLGNTVGQFLMTSGENASPQEAAPAPRKAGVLVPDFDIDSLNIQSLDSRDAAARRRGATKTSGKDLANSLSSFMLSQTEKKEENQTGTTARGRARRERRQHRNRSMGGTYMYIPI